jgi:hypothetical protein
MRYITRTQLAIVALFVFSTLTLAQGSQPQDSSAEEQLLNDARRANEEAQAEYYREQTRKLRQPTPTPAPTPAKSFLQSLAVEESEKFRNLGLVFIGLIGLPFLIWRTFSSHRASIAALRQSEASLKQSEVAVQQIQVAIKQSEAALNQAQAAARQAEIAADRQITDILTRAFDQLGNEERAVRLGAVYALERIAHDSRRDHHAIMEALTSYIRAQAPYSWGADIELSAETQALFAKPEMQAISQEMMPEYKREQPKLSPEIEAILSILGRRNPANEPFGKRLDLSRTDLRGAKLLGTPLQRASFMYANLMGAWLSSAHLEEAVFAFANLKGAHFNDTHLNDADFTGADLEGAHFDGAILVGAKFDMATLKKAKFCSANLRKTDLQNAFDLTQEQIDQAFCDEETKLPAGLMIKTRSE